MANQFGKQMANREVCDMVFVDYKTKEPFLFCDYANTSMNTILSSIQEQKRNRLKSVYIHP